MKQTGKLEKFQKRAFDKILFEIKRKGEEVEYYPLFVSGFRTGFNKGKKFNSEKIKKFSDTIDKLNSLFCKIPQPSSLKKQWEDVLKECYKPKNIKVNQCRKLSDEEVVALLEKEGRHPLDKVK